MIKRILFFSGYVGATLHVMGASVGAEPPKLNPTEIYKDIESLDAQDGSISATSNAARKRSKPKADGSQGQQVDGPTVIHALDSEYNEEVHQAVFEHSVVVNNASFNLVCNKLTAFMHHEEAPKAVAVKPASIPASPAPAGGRKAPGVAEGGGLEKAVAEGDVEVTQDKVDDNGNIKHSVGHGKRMIYEAATGKVTLLGKPDLQQGDDLCIALAESTVMVLDRSGHMEAFGPVKTVIKESPQGQKAGDK